jgi:hypothetical protein
MSGTMNMQMFKHLQSTVHITGDKYQVEFEVGEVFIVFSRLNFSYSGEKCYYYFIIIMSMEPLVDDTALFFCSRRTEV